MRVQVTKQSTLTNLSHWFPEFLLNPFFFSSFYFIDSIELGFSWRVKLETFQHFHPMYIFSLVAVSHYSAVCLLWILKQAMLAAKAWGISIRNSLINVISIVFLFLTVLLKCGCSFSSFIFSLPYCSVLFVRSIERGYKCRQLMLSLWKIEIFSLKFWNNYSQESILFWRSCNILKSRSTSDNLPCLKKSSP